jgi:hypothetical protein
MSGNDISAAGNVYLNSGKNLGLGQYASDPNTAGWTTSQKGYTWFNTTTNEVKYWNGSSIKAMGVAGTGISNINGETGGTHQIAVGTAGSDFAITSASNVHTIDLPTASATKRGALSSTDWSIFSGKMDSLTVGSGLTGGTITGSGTIGLGVELAGLNAVSTAGFVKRVSSGSYQAVTLSSADLSNNSDLLKATNMPANCSANQALTFSSPSGTWVCSTIANLDTSALTTGTIAGARLPASATYWAAGSGANIGYTAGNVGIGTTAPTSTLTVAGNITTTQVVITDTTVTDGSVCATSGSIGRDAAGNIYICN